MARYTPQQIPKPVPVLVQASLGRLGARLVKARKARELTQEELARISDVGVSTVRTLETLGSGVSLCNLLKVLRGLGLMDQIEQLLDPAKDPEMLLNMPF